MGLFLQKTNIIRDYLEDYVDHRAFWPQTIWKKYAKTGELGYFTQQKNLEVKARSLECLNELVTDALEHAPDCLSYLSKLGCTEIFRFCAIPQVMAIATLNYCYGNANVFTGVLKIRKGTSCKLILRTNTLDEVHDTFYQFAHGVTKKADSYRAKGVLDPSYSRTIKVCETIMKLTINGHKRQRQARQLPFVFSLVLCFAGITASAYFHVDSDVLKLPQNLVVLGIGAYTFSPCLIRQSSGLTDSKVLENKGN
jgi:hypothetical protein